MGQTKSPEKLGNKPLKNTFYFHNCIILRGAFKNKKYHRESFLEKTERKFTGTP